RRRDLSRSSQGAVDVKCRTRLRRSQTCNVGTAESASPSKRSYPALARRCPAPSTYVTSAQRLQCCQLSRRQRTRLAFGELAQLDRAEANSNQPLDAQSDRCTKTPDLALSSLGYGNLELPAVTAKLARLDALGPDCTIVKHHAAAGNFRRLVGLSCDDRHI